ncbi:MAG: HAD family hydrolase [Candidatus Bathyarchaeia archaeon]
MSRAGFKPVFTVFVDYDNTLHDTDSKYAEAFEGYLGMTGDEFLGIYVNRIHREIVHFKYPDRHDDLDFHGRLVAQYFGRPKDESLISELKARFRRAEQECLRSPLFFPDVEGFLVGLRQRRFKVCLATGEDSQAKGAALNQAFPGGYFDYIFGERELGVLKTEPQYFVKALELTGSKPASTATVGDAPLTDIKPAKAVGLKTVWLNRRGALMPYESLRPDYEVRNLTEALTALDKLATLSRA